MSGFELDHLFIAGKPEAPGIERLLGLGLLEGSRNVHPGQGTANRRIFFQNAMLEFLWLVDEAEARSAPIQRTHLAERCDPAREEVCPFGICLRAATAGAQAAPFATWPFRPPYLPAVVSIAVATNSHRLHEPFIFTIPFGGRPDQLSAEKRQPLDHPVGMREITGVTLVLPPAPERSSALRHLQEAGIVELATGGHYRLELELDGGHRHQGADLTPDLPLLVRW